MLSVSESAESGPQLEKCGRIARLSEVDWKPTLRINFDFEGGWFSVVEPIGIEPTTS